MNKASLLELAKMLNIPPRNCMKTKEELDQATKDTITRWKEIIFGSGTLACIACLDELWKQQVIDQKIWSKADGRYNEENRMLGIVNASFSKFSVIAPHSSVYVLFGSVDLVRIFLDLFLVMLNLKWSITNLRLSEENGKSRNLKVR